MIPAEAAVAIGSGAARAAPHPMLARIEREPKLLRLPLVRAGNFLCAGRDEAGWKQICESAKPGPK